jgi:hypothetical protein
VAHISLPLLEACTRKARPSCSVPIFMHPHEEIYLLQSLWQHYITAVPTTRRNNMQLQKYNEAVLLEHILLWKWQLSNTYLWKTHIQTLQSASTKNCLLEKDTYPLKRQKSSLLILILFCLKSRITISIS